MSEASACTGPTVLSVISLVGGVDWSIFLGLPKDTAVALAKSFAGFDIPFESDDLGDAIGELSNILAGNVKARLDRVGIKTEDLAAQRNAM